MPWARPCLRNLLFCTSQQVSPSLQAECGHAGGTGALAVVHGEKQLGPCSCPAASGHTRYEAMCDLAMHSFRFRADVMFERGHPCGCIQMCSSISCLLLRTFCCADVTRALQLSTAKCRVSSLYRVCEPVAHQLDFKLLAWVINLIKNPKKMLALS